MGTLQFIWGYDQVALPAANFTGFLRHESYVFMAAFRHARSLNAV
jgi:hypothetical protein